MKMRARLILFSSLLFAITVLIRLERGRSPSEVPVDLEEVSGILKLESPAKTGRITEVSVVSSSSKPTQVIQASDKALAPVLELKVGEKWNYKGFTLMRIEKNDLITDREMQLIEEQWNYEVKNFIIHELGLGELAFEGYLQAKRDFFLSYDLRIVPIQHEIRERFGTQVQLIHGDELWQLYEISRKSYRNRLRTILGSDGFVRYEDLRDYFSEWIYQKFNVGWNDLR